MTEPTMFEAHASYVLGLRFTRDGRLRYGIAAYNVGPAWLKKIGISHKVPQHYLRRFREVWQELLLGEPLPWLASDRLLQLSPEDEPDTGEMDWFLPLAEAIRATTEPSSLRDEAIQPQDGFNPLTEVSGSWLTIGYRGYR